MFIVYSINLPVDGAVGTIHAVMEHAAFEGVFGLFMCARASNPFSVNEDLQGKEEHRLDQKIDAAEQRKRVMYIVGRSIRIPPFNIIAVSGSHFKEHTSDDLHDITSHIDR